MSAPTVTESMIEGLELVLAVRERRIGSALHVGDDVLKADVYQWRKGHDLAHHAENHAVGILAAVEAYRRADLELTEARATLSRAAGAALIGRVSPPQAPESGQTQSGGAE